MARDLLQPRMSPRMCQFVVSSSTLNDKRNAVQIFHERSEAEICEASFFSAIWDKEVHGGPDLAENPQFSPDEFDNEYTSSVVTFSAQI